MLDRTELRHIALTERSRMPAPYRAHKSALLSETLLNSLDITLGLGGVDPRECSVAVYAAFPEEVDLGDFIEGAYERGVCVAFPCMINDARGSAKGCPQTMEMRAVGRKHYEARSAPFIAHPLKRYDHDSTELDEFPYVAGDELTMIVVPVVAFDGEGNRLGYGGGNYDRYLTQVSDGCRVVGVAFAEQEVDAIPVEEHDRALTVISL